MMAALSAASDARKRPVARRFLKGLSTDELQYLAEYLGACILDPRLAGTADRFGCCRRPGAFEDQAHKLIVLREYLLRVS